MINSVIVTGDKLLSVSWTPVINLSPVLTTPAINENPVKSLFNGANDIGDYFIAGVIDTAELNSGVVNTVL
jgi:hypothetical protein